MSKESVNIPRLSPRALVSRAGNSYAGADIEMARRFGRVNWGIGTAVVLVLVAFYPPTRAVGALGWLVALPGTLMTVAGLAVVRRNPERVTYDFLWYAAWIALAQVALLQWLAGGRVAPYHEIYLFQIIGTALMHPPRRFALFVAAVVAAGFAPAVYASSTARVGEIATEQFLWVGLGVFLLLFMRRVRAQRVELKQVGDEASQLARVDPLTGLGNRRAFDEALERELAEARADGRAVRLLVADLNDFKEINDVHGHLAGDHCLRAAAEALRATVRSGDGCFRWGGDEFAVIAGPASADDAAALAARIEHAVAGACHAPTGRPLSIACGHAAVDGAATPTEAIAAADAALLALKRRRSSVVRAF